MDGQRLISKLMELGYPNANQLKGSDFDWVVSTPEIASFFEQFCDDIDIENVVTDEEMKEYKQLQASGIQILDCEKLVESLDILQLPRPEENTNALKQKVLELQEEIKNKEEKIELLTKNKSRSSYQLQNLKSEISTLDTLNQISSQDLNQMHQTCLLGVEKLNSILGEISTKGLGVVDDLQDIVENKCSTFKGYVMSPLDTFLWGEEQFNEELRQFLAKQFFDKIERMAGQDDEFSYHIVSVKLPDTTLLTGQSQKEYLKNCHKLDTLHEIYVPSHLQLLEASIGYHQAEAAKKKLEELLDKLVSGRIPSIPKHLKTIVDELEMTIKSRRIQVQELLENKIPQMLKECANAEAAEVIVGDYSVKIARQQYFLSKQDLVLKCLVEQRSHITLLSFLFERELSKFEELHNLMDSIVNDLNRSDGDVQKFMNFISELQQKDYVDCEDSSAIFSETIQDLITMGLPNSMNVKKSDDIMVSTRSFVRQCVIAEQQANKRDDEHIQVMASLENNLSLLQSSFTQDITSTKSTPWKSHSRPLKLNPWRGLFLIVSSATELKKKAAEFLQRVSVASKMFGDHKQLLTTQPSLQKELNFLLMFYSNPEKLISVIENLEKQLAAKRSNR